MNDMVWDVVCIGLSTMMNILSFLRILSHTYSLKGKDAH